MDSFLREKTQNIEIIGSELLEKVREIDSGAFGKVFEYVFKPTNEKRAVKLLLSRSDEVVENEIAPLVLLKHDNIVIFYGRTQISEFRGIVLEFMEGGNLKKVIHDKSISYTLEDILNWNIQSASALDYMHSLKLGDDSNTRFIHRDIKPQNLLLDINRDILKICDFGQSKEIDTSGNSSGVGTMSYIAPEVCRGVRYNEKCDVYSWAVTFWECITRKSPFGECRSEMEIQGKKYKNDYFFPDVENGSGKFNQILKCCSHPIPVQRMSMAAAKTLLENMLANCQEGDESIKGKKEFQEKISIQFSSNGNNQWCFADGLKFNTWGSEFENSLSLLETNLRELENEKQDLDKQVLWSISKDFDINFCKDLDKSWENSYTSFFQLSLFDKQYRFKICASFKGKIYFFTTNKELQFEELNCFDTHSSEIKTLKNLPKPQEFLTCATFTTDGKKFMLVGSERISSDDSRKCQLYDFARDKWNCDYEIELPKNDFKHVQLVGCKTHVMAFFTNDNSGDSDRANEVYLFNKSNRSWTKPGEIKAPNSRYKHSYSSLASHNGSVYLTNGEKFEKFTPNTSGNSWEEIQSSPGTKEGQSSQAQLNTNSIKMISFKDRLYALIENGNGHDIETFDDSKKKWNFSQVSIPVNFSGMDFITV